MADWWLTKDGDASCLALYERHYSAYRYADQRMRKLFVGPGEKIVLRTCSGDAVWVWRKFRIQERVKHPIVGAYQTGLRYRCLLLA